MDKPDERLKDMRKAINDLFEVDEAVRDKGFASICAYVSDKDTEVICEELMSRGETRSYFWLVEYLVKTETVHGLKKLRELAGNEDEQVRELATIGISKINEDLKVDFLVDLLVSDWEKQIRFVAGILGKSGKVRAVIPIVSALNKWKDSRKTSIALIKALASLRDNRAISILVKIASTTPDKQIQSEALMALTRFTVRLGSGSIKRIISSGNEQVREMVYLTILRSGYRGWDKYIVQCLRSKESNKVKGNILSIIKSMPSYDLFKTVLNMALNDPSEWVRLMALSAIRSTRSKKTFRWLLKYEKVGKTSERIVILKILTGFKDSPIVDMLIKNFKTSSDRRIKLTAIECLGRNKTPKVISFLMKEITKKSIYAMAATVSLSHMMGPDDLDIAERILFMDPKKYSWSIQAFLSFISRLPKACTLSSGIENRILELTKDENINVRYLATRCLARTNMTEKIIYLIDISKTDKESYVKEGAARSIVDIINDSPGDRMAILFMCFDSRCLYFTLNRILGTISTDPKEFNDLIKLVLGLVSSEKLKRDEKTSLGNIRFMVFLRKQLVNNFSLFLEYFETKETTDRERWVILHVLNSLRQEQLPRIKADYMVEQYHRSLVPTKLEYLKLFKKIREGNEKIENLVFNEYSIEKNEELVEKLREIIAEWTVETITA